ncbi:FAD binding domain-containing protein [Conexibacter woesei]|uniref:Molybdopterin dehydrogenase FAD-binding protein n=1 Tax=Conexibacter woesei (strain DSM 14684 / CCUG 47730 / CIP 108061 / JCM 11494 / NBRC 100937 / ID131577) TaxID=469383 RepID=D3F4R2_CONWI|nr:xanthine dehydrogenase family protein subunit M [Conexibacter woesei]ADB52519.1 molybdopterin dehydrogenase FAD-binding protein [Conexibacter woesei DSM 14684]
MKPAPFDYVRPASVGDAIAALAADEDAKPIAGGQSLMPMLNMRLAQPTTLVDLNALPELSYVRREGGHLVVGGMTRQRLLEQDPAARDALPFLADVLGHVGHVAIRNRGTVGGSIAHADPAAELPLVAVALDAELVAQGPGGRRTIAAADFFRMFLTTALEPGELLVEVRLPTAAGGWTAGFEELSRRHGDFAIVSVLALVDVDGDGRASAARIAIGGANPVPLRAHAAEELLVGRPLDASAIAAASASAAVAVEPTWDVHGSAEYRREMTAVLVGRALSQVAEGKRSR